MKRKKPQAPKSLSTASKQLWAAILKDNPSISGAARLKVLQVGLESLDRANSAKAIVDKTGEIVLDRFKQERVNPACAVERDARAQFLQAVKQLALKPNDEHLKPAPVRKRERRA